MKEKFYDTAKSFFNDVKDIDYCMEYTCLECGCTFFGRWHSDYSMNKVKCLRCGVHTDPLYIRMGKSVKREEVK